MSTSYNNFVRNLHTKILKLRAIERLVLSDDFKKLYEDSNTFQRVKALNLIKNFDVKGIKLWIDNHPEVEIPSLSLEKLRKLGQEYQIKNYSRLTRYELIGALLNERKNYKNEKMVKAT